MSDDLLDRIDNQAKGDEWHVAALAKAEIIRLREALTTIGSIAATTKGPGYEAIARHVREALTESEKPT